MPRPAVLKPRHRPLPPAGAIVPAAPVLAVLGWFLRGRITPVPMPAYDITQNERARALFDPRKDVNPAGRIIFAGRFRRTGLCDNPR